MGNIRINPIPALTKACSSSFRHSGGNGGNRDDNKSNFSGRAFQDVFEQVLERQAESEVQFMKQEGRLM